MLAFKLARLGYCQLNRQIRVQATRRWDEDALRCLAPTEANHGHITRRILGQQVNHIAKSRVPALGIAGPAQNDQIRVPAPGCVEDSGANVASHSDHRVHRDVKGARFLNCCFH